MKKFIFAAFMLLFLTLPLHGRDQVWFIPGWLSSYESYEPHKQQLAQIYPNSDISVRYWRSTRLWHTAMKNAENFAVQLADEICKSREPGNIILVGHSLGGFIISHLAPILQQRDVRVKAIVYLGAAIDLKNRGVIASTQISRDPVVNIFSYGDGILKYLYVNAERNLPLGLIGLPRRLPHLRQYHVETGINFTLKQSFEELFNHLASKYLDALWVIKCKPASSEFYVDYNSLEKVAAKGSVTVKNVSVPQVKTLPTVKEYGNWRLSYFEVTVGIFGKKLWLLVSPIGSHYLFAGYRDAETRFYEVQKHLSKQLR